MLILRDYQQRAVDAIREAFTQGYRKVLLYGPCGFGKTEAACYIMESVKSKGKRSMFLADRIVLCNQTSARLDKYGIEHGVQQAGHWRFRPYEQIQVCSIHTLIKRGDLPDSSLTVHDECHHQYKFTREFTKNTNSFVIGLTGSPFTKGLGELYTKVVSVITMDELVKLGNLVPLKVYIAKEIDMSGAKKTAGEWTTEEVTQRGKVIVGDIVENWYKKTKEHFGGPVKTIVFSAGVDHGAYLAEEFNKAGFNFVNISYRDDDEFKENMFTEFDKPDSDIHGLIATDILTKGFDQSDVKCLISARPFSKSFSSWVQQLGRGMRAHEGKDFCLLLDHSGNYLRFQSDWDDLYFNGVKTLDDSKDRPRKEPEKKEKEAAKCPVCSALWLGGDKCGSCGYVRPKRNEVIEVPGELVELKAKFTNEQMQSWYSQFLGYARQHKLKDGFAYYKFMEKFKMDPPKFIKNLPLNPGIEVSNWIKHTFIRRAKSQKKVA